LTDERARASIAVVRLVALSLALLAVAPLAGCSESPSGTPSKPRAALPCPTTELVTESRVRRSGPAGLSISWDGPLGAPARAVSSIDEAKELLPFTPLVSAGLGDPCEILVSRVRPHQFVQRFDHPSIGIFHVTQTPLEVTPERAERTLRGMAGPCARQGCEGAWSLVRLEAGRPGLLVTGKGIELAVHNLVFNDPAREIQVVIQRPPATFSGTEAIAVANAFLWS